jgi:hypothetical protein
MEKTAKQIEKDVFRIIKSSVLRDNVKGKFYRDGTRPKDASTEDVVVKFQTGVDGQEQSGVVLVHIYVPNVPAKDGETIEDITRIDHLENLLNQVVSEINDTEYLFEKDGTPQSYPVEGISQHFINMRLYYRRKTF